MFQILLFFLRTDVRRQAPTILRNMPGNRLAFRYAQLSGYHFHFRSYNFFVHIFSPPFFVLGGGFEPPQPELVPSCSPAIFPTKNARASRSIASSNLQGRSPRYHLALLRFIPQKNRLEVGSTLASFANFASGNIRFQLLRAYPSSIFNREAREGNSIL